jgi:hypothetical protein
LAPQLRLRVREDVVGLCREPAEGLVGQLSGAERGEDVGGRLEDDLGVPVSFFILPCAAAVGRKVGDGGRPSR